MYARVEIEILQFAKARSKTKAKNLRPNLKNLEDFTQKWNFLS